MLTWQWTPFAVLIFMTSLQSEDQQQKKPLYLMGQARGLNSVISLCRIWRGPIAIVVMIQAIFHFSFMQR